MFFKIINFLRIFYYAKFKFTNRKSKKLIIFDNSDIFALKETPLKRFDYFLFEDRGYLISKIYISLDILRLVFLNRKYGIKFAYKIAIIKIVNPNLIITFIHNSENFSNLAKVMHKQYNFLAIQNSSFYYRIREANFLKKKYNIPIKNYFIPRLLCYSKFDKENYIKESKVKIEKFDIIGSLRLENFKNTIKKKKIKINKTKYDICLLSEVDSWELKDSKLDFKFAKLIKFVIRYSQEEKKKLIFALKRPQVKNIKDITPQAKYVIQGYYNEQKWYKKYFNESEYKFLKKRFKFQYPYSSYEASIESRVTIASMSTMLREVFSLKKKILACNFTSNKVYDFPIKGISSINFDCDYEYFKKRLDKILEISSNKYFSAAKLKKDHDLIENKNNKTISKIISIVKDYL